MTLPGCIATAVMGIFPASNRRCNSFVQSTFASFVYAAWVIPVNNFPVRVNRLLQYTFSFGLHVLVKSLLNASRLSYRGFGTQRCATEDTCVLSIKAALILPSVARTFTIRTSDPGSNAVFSITGKSVLVNKNGLMWLYPTDKTRRNQQGRESETIQTVQTEPRDSYLLDDHTIRDIIRRSSIRT